MKSFLDFAKEKENDELKRQIDHYEKMADEHEEKAEAALMMGDRDGHALHMAKNNHFKTQGENLKGMKEEVEQIDELDTGTLKRYTKKALSQTMSSAKKGDMATSDKRSAGMLKALDKIKQREPMDTSRSLKNITKNWHKEEVEQIDEMDKSQPSSDRGGESSGDPYAKGDKAKPVKTKNFTDKAGKILSQAMNKAYKKNVKEEVELDEATPAWQRKEGKSEAGGLNKKGIMSYRRANPGSKLSMAVTTKPSKLKPGSKAANRRKSFCARMSGMKKRLTSAKTAKDPNSRINKSLRKWNC